MTISGATNANFQVNLTRRDAFTTMKAKLAHFVILNASSAFLVPSTGPNST